MQCESDFIEDTPVPSSEVRRRLIGRLQAPREYVGQKWLLWSGEQWTQRIEEAPDETQEIEAMEATLLKVLSHQKSNIILVSGFIFLRLSSDSVQGVPLVIHCWPERSPQTLVSPATAVRALFLLCWSYVESPSFLSTHIVS
jgi:hypothetical protein